jgi:hypothetical protein
MLDGSGLEHAGLHSRSSMQGAGMGSPAQALLAHGSRVSYLPMTDRGNAEPAHAGEAGCC